MRTRAVKETAIICAAGVLALALLTIPLELRPNGAPPNSKAIVAVFVAAIAGLGVVMWFRYLSTKKKAQVELAGGEQYRQLADEYRRLADMVVTAQEHTDLKLGDVNAQLDYLREQNESLQKILKDVE